MKTATSKLGFGTWQFGGEYLVDGKHKGWGYINEQAAIDAVHFALDNGIRFFDTADAYGEGKSEVILGKAFKSYPSADFIICTKFGNRKDNQGNSFQDFSPAWLEESVTKSLQRLKIDYIDILLFHSPPDDFEWKSYDITVIDRLIEKGYIKKYGVSSKSLKGALKVAKDNFGSAIEAIFNVLDRRAESYLFGNIENQYEFIARVPLASGFLNQKYLDKNPDFAENDWRRYLPERDRNWFLESIRKLAFLDELPGGLTVSALRYVLHHSGVGVVIPGMKNIEQVKANLQAVELGALDADVVEKIKQAVPDVPEHWKF
ncbi:aldo/keto reductase [Nostoc sp. FACHB-152]|uniref:aldo/keto reductase n=1 Tax=unclassified Nostoc TaxID=2593658 RepID=UPI001685B378|nr:MULTISPECIES: aldo/keto reductase [unclassified Nostoc]MBD2451079.1 aldo/keto reductase [Nostoc sp. FACHB-152]MBD2472583.1 aldo/keto reductase [Nostoc sp. FACHB-145]